MAVLTGIDFFTVEMLTWRGLATYYVLFFIQLESRRVALAGITRHPDTMWMEQMARNAADPDSGHLRNQRYILHDRDTKFCSTFRSILESEGAKCLTLPPRSPNLNAFAEECLRKLILFGEGSLRRAMAEYGSHFHGERNHQGKGNVLLISAANCTKRLCHVIERTQRLGGLLRYCRRAA